MPDGGEKAFLAIEEVPEGVSAGEEGRLKVAEGGELLRAPSHVGKGTWIDAAWHMGTAIPTPAAVFPISYALSRLGWAAGVIGLTAGGIVTFYTSFLLASLNCLNGKRFARYRDLAYEVYGAKGAYFVFTLQLVVNFGSVLISVIPSGQGMKFMYQLYHPDEGPTLQEWIIMFGCFQILLAMIPDLHSLRFLNFFCTMCVIIMSVVAFGLALNDGLQADRASIDFGVHGSPANKVFSIFNAMATISLAYGNTMLPEIQATVREPVVKNMYKAIAGSYVIIVAAYFGVGIVGYWAYGFDVSGYLLFSLSTPKWAVMLANTAAVAQFAGTFQFYCQIIFELLETKYGDPEQHPFAMRNLLPRFFFRTSVIALVTLIGCAMPFFGDFVALIGAIGFTPMDFILPLVIYNQVHKLPFLHWGLNWTIVIFYSVVGLCGAVGAVRSIIINSINFKLFANL